MKTLRPLVLFKNKSEKHRPEIFKQNMLLKAMEYTTDVDELKDALKFQSRAEVFRTMDKLAMRKDFHRALSDAGLSMDSIASRYKQLLASPSEKIQLGALTALSKALGVDKYEVIDEGARDWEQTLLNITEKERNQKAIEGKAEVVEEIEDYEVKIPPVPESIRKQREEDAKEGQELYEIINGSKRGIVDAS